MKKVVLLISTVAIVGCGTMAGSTEQVTVTTEPDDAKIVKDGSVVGRTPGTVSLDSNNPNDKSFTVEKEGYESESVRMSTSISGPVVVLDLLLGGWPLLVDLATDNLDEFDRTSYSFVLEESDEAQGIANAKEDESSSRSSSGSNSVFTSDSEDSDDSSEGNDDESSEKNQEGRMVEVKNSSYQDFEDMLTILESIEELEVSGKTFKGETSQYEISTELTASEVIEKFKNRNDEPIGVEKVSDEEIVVEIEN